MSDPNYILEKIMALHIKLTQTAKLINKGYRIQLLILLLVCFLAIVYAFYLLGMNFISTTSNQKKMENNVTFLIWVVENTISLLTIVYSTSSLCDEVRVRKMKQTFLFRIETKKKKKKRENFDFFIY